MAESAPQDFECTSVETALLSGLDCLRVAVTLFDADGRLSYANQHFGYLSAEGVSSERFLGQTLGEIVEDGLECVGGWSQGADPSDLDPLYALTQHRKNHALRPFVLRLADGRWIEFKERPNAGHGSIALWSDITALEHGRLRLHDAFEDASEAFAFWGQSGTLVTANEAFLAQHGLPGDLLGPPLTYNRFLERMVENGVYELPIPADQWLAERRRNRRMPRERWVVRHRNGAWLLVRERRCRDGGHVMLLSDVTDLKQAESALASRDKSLRLAHEALFHSENRLEQQKLYMARMAREVEGAKREGREAKAGKTAFTRAMNHELRTPLNAIIGFADLIRGEMLGPIPDARYREYAELIHDSGAYLLALLGHIMDLTKLEAGDYEFKNEPVDVGELVYTRLEAFESKAEARGLTLASSVRADLPRVALDETALSRAFDCLLDNAIKFTGTGGRVTVSLQLTDGKLTLSVEDTGIGIPDGDIERILKPFEQGERGPNGSDLGAGLGLALATAFANGMGGSLSLTSQRDEGTKAVIALPAQNRQAAEAA